MGIIENLGPGGQQLPAVAGPAGPSGVGYTPKLRPGAALGPVCPTTSTSTPINGQAGAAPFVIPASGLTFSAVVVDVTAAGSAGALARPVLWADDGSYFPGAVLWDCGDANRIDVTTTGLKTLTLTTPVTLPTAEADYVIWGAVITQGTPATLPQYRAGSGSIPFMLSLANASAASVCAYSRTGITGTPPAWTGTTPALTTPAMLRLVLA